MELNTNNYTPDSVPQQKPVPEPPSPDPVPENESNKNTNKSFVVFVVLIVILGVIASFTYLFTDIFPKDNFSITVRNAESMIGERYGLNINFPAGWTAEDCIKENKRYLDNEARYVCKWSSPVHPRSGEQTLFSLFVLRNNSELSQAELEQFARERQEYEWGKEVEHNPALSVTFDNRLETVSYNGFVGLQAEDIVINTETKDWKVWTSTVVPVVTPEVTMLLEFNHPNNTLSGREVYTVIDILEYISVQER